MKNTQWILASDIDNTLTGNPSALRRLGEKITNLRRQEKLKLFLTTGRSLQEVLDGFAREDIPHADAIITQVGTEIYIPPFSAEMEPLPEWNRRLHQQFSREKAVQFIDDIEGAEIQPQVYNTPLKVSYFLENAPNPEQAAELVKQRVARDGGNYQVVWSSGKHLDILPAAAGKGNAIRFLIDFLQLAPQKVITAGDSGNDRSMLEAFEYGIIVGNAQPELKQLQAESQRNGYYFAQNSFAAGVEEGLRHFGLF